MEQPDISTVRDETDTAASEAILSELFGPLADRVRGTGPKAAYVNLLLSSVFLRHKAQPSWADLREDVREALDAQSAPVELLRIIGRRADTALRKHRLPPGISAAVDDLRGDAIEDLAHVIRLCEDLGPKDFSALLDRFGAWMGADDESSLLPAQWLTLWPRFCVGTATKPPGSMTRMYAEVNFSSARSGPQEGSRSPEQVHLPTCSGSLG